MPLLDDSYSVAQPADEGLDSSGAAAGPALLVYSSFIRPAFYESDWIEGSDGGVTSNGAIIRVLLLPTAVRGRPGRELHWPACLGQLPGAAAARASLGAGLAQAPRSQLQPPALVGAAGERHRHGGVPVCHASALPGAAAGEACLGHQHLRCRARLHCAAAASCRQPAAQRGAVRRPSQAYEAFNSIRFASGPVSKLMLMHPKLTQGAQAICSTVSQGVAVVTGFDQNWGAGNSPCSPSNAVARRVLMTQVGAGRAQPPGRRRCLPGGPPQLPLASRRRPAGRPCAHAGRGQPDAAAARHVHGGERGQVRVPGARAGRGAGAGARTRRARRARGGPGGHWCLDKRSAMAKH
jgi:hypothetical protein